MERIPVARETPATASRPEADGQLAALYDDCAAAAYSLCLAIVRDEDLAVDIVAGACRAAPPASLSSRSVWVLTEVHRRAVIAARQPAPSGRHRSETQRLLALDALSDHQRLALELTYFGGLSVGTVAERLAVSREHVLGLLTSALTQMQEPDRSLVEASSPLSSPATPSPASRSDPAPPPAPTPSRARPAPPPGPAAARPAP